LGWDTQVVVDSKINAMAAPTGHEPTWYREDRPDYPAIHHF
jgi:hypothetical protein